MRHFVISALGAPLLLLLAACAAPPADLDAPTETEVTRNLRTAFDYLYDNYYDEDIRLENVVLPGLQNLSSLEPGLQIVDAPIPLYRFRTEVLLNGAVIHTFHKPAWYAGDGWAAVVRETIKALKKVSPEVAAALGSSSSSSASVPSALSEIRPSAFSSRRDM